MNAAVQPADALICGIVECLSPMTAQGACICIMQMKRMSMIDSRQNPDAVKRLIGWQRNRLTDSLREMVFRAAPSARR